MSLPPVPRQSLAHLCASEMGSAASRICNEKRRHLRTSRVVDTHVFGSEDETNEEHATGDSARCSPSSQRHAHSLSKTAAGQKFSSFLAPRDIVRKGGWERDAPPIRSILRKLAGRCDTRSMRTTAISLLIYLDCDEWRQNRSQLVKTFFPSPLVRSAAQVVND